MTSIKKALKRSKFAAFLMHEDGMLPHDFGNSEYKRARLRAKLAHKKTMRDAKRARTKEAKNE